MPSLIDLLLPELESETVTTRKVLAAVPEARFAWKPHAKSFPMRELAGHVAELISWTSLVLGSERLDIESSRPPENASFKPTSAEEMLAKFEGWAGRAHADLKRATDAALDQPWAMTWDGYELYRGARYGAIRKWSLNHMIHHRAQLQVYLRLNDVPVPGAYGPSADQQS